MNVLEVLVRWKKPAAVASYPPHHTQPDPPGLLLLTHHVASPPTSPGRCGPSPRAGGIHASISALSPPSSHLRVISYAFFSVWTRVLTRGWGGHLPRGHVMLSGDVPGCHGCSGYGAVLAPSGEAQRRCDAPYNTQHCPTARNDPAPNASGEGSRSRLGLGPRPRVPVLGGPPGCRTLVE